MDLGEAVVIVAGVGCRRGASAPQITDAIHEALRSVGHSIEEVRRLATAEHKAEETGLRAAARLLGLPLVAIPHAALTAAAGGAETRSERVLALLGLPSLAETAALACAGPAGRLLARRSALGPVTCALAAFPENAP